MKPASLRALLRNSASLFTCGALGAAMLLGCGGMVSPSESQGASTEGRAALDDAGTPANDAQTTAAEPTSASVITLAELGLGITGTYARCVGQSVTLPATGPFDHVRFNWYGFEGEGHPVAFGTLYVLNREYLGSPSALGPSTPGFVGKSMSIEGGQYVFPSDMVLASGARYWLYTDTPGDFLTSKAISEDMYPAGEQYSSGSADVPFQKSGSSSAFMDATFRLQGHPVR